MCGEVLWPVLVFPPGGRLGPVSVPTSGPEKSGMGMWVLGDASKTLLQK